MYIFAIFTSICCCQIRLEFVKTENNQWRIGAVDGTSFIPILIIFAEFESVHWMNIYFHDFVVKIEIFVWKRRKIEEKMASEKNGHQKTLKIWSLCSPSLGTSSRSVQTVPDGLIERPWDAPGPGTSCRRRPLPSWKAQEWPRDVPGNEVDRLGDVLPLNILAKWLFVEQCFIEGQFFKAGSHYAANMLGPAISVTRCWNRILPKIGQKFAA